MSRILVPQSEDFLYWDPEEICRYPQPPGSEDAWFREAEAAGAGARNESREADA